MTRIAAVLVVVLGSLLAERPASPKPKVETVRPLVERLSSEDAASRSAAERDLLASIMIVMASATAWHVVRGEISSAVVTLVLLAMATFVAYMRHRVRPIPSRAV